jgi:hypothetical protein
MRSEQNDWRIITQLLYHGKLTAPGGAGGAAFRVAFVSGCESRLRLTGTAGSGSAKLARIQNVPEDGDSEPGMESTQKPETHPVTAVLAVSRDLDKSETVVYSEQAGGAVPARVCTETNKEARLCGQGTAS